MDDFLLLADILLFAEASGSSQRETLTATSKSPDERRAVVAERLRATAEVVGFYGHDPLLTTLAGLRRRRHDLDAAMRRLLAYGREFSRRRPYRLADLADAAGMSISGVRTAYDADEIRQVAQAPGLMPTASRSTTKLSKGHATIRIDHIGVSARAGSMLPVFGRAYSAWTPRSGTMVASRRCASGAN